MAFLIFLQTLRLQAVLFCRMSVHLVLSGNTDLLNLMKARHLHLNSLHKASLQSNKRRIILN